MKSWYFFFIVDIVIESFIYLSLFFRLSFQVANGLLQCIWEIVIDVKNLPYATPENIRINVICGESSIAESTFESLIEKVDSNWEYLKNLTDNLYDFIRKLSRKDLLNYNMCC